MDEQKKISRKARKIRHALTSTEKKLWNEVLKNNSFGYKFIQKEAIGEAIADFYCPKLGLAINVDGNIELKDKREKILESHGILVLKYPSQNIMNHIDLIEIDIAKKIQEREGKYFFNE